MSKTSASRSAKARASEELPLINPEIYTQVAFALTVALVIARAIMVESVRGSVDAIVGGLGAPRGPGPATSLFLDAFCALPAILVLVRRVMDRTYVVRWTWSCVLVALLAIWAVASVAWSTDRFLTLINAANTVGSALLIWSTAQLVRSWVRLRIVAGVCVGLMFVYAVHGLKYKLMDAPDTVKYFTEHKQDILNEHGWEPDSFSAKQFEQKLRNAEMIGFHTSPNSFAAVLVMLLAVGAGLVIQRARDGKTIYWLIGGAALAAPVLLTLRYTEAKTAVGTLVLSLAALGLLGSSRVRAILAARSVQVYWAMLALFVLGVAALVGHGIAHGSLPQDSLNFRWWYWTAAAKLVKQHPVLGVGWGNFGEPYLSVRLPVAAEEVRDPHNFLVRAFAELGFIGGLPTIFWLARAAWEVTRAVSPPVLVSGGKRSALLFAIAGIVGGVLLNAVASVDFTQPGAYLILETFERLMAMGLLTMGVMIAAVGGRDGVLDTRPAPWLLYGLLVGLGAFFVHNLVEFVLAEPGPLTIFSVLLGAAIGLRTNWTVKPNPEARKPLIGVIVAASLIWLIVIGVVVIPIADADSRAQDGDDQVQAGHPDLGAALLSGAFHTVPYNTDYAFRAARYMAMAGEQPESVKAMLEQAIAADRRFVSPYLMLANIEMHQPSPNTAAVRARITSRRWRLIRRMFYRGWITRMRW